MASLMPLPRLDKCVSIRESTFEAALAVIQNAQCLNSWDKKCTLGAASGMRQRSFCSAQGIQIILLPTGKQPACLTAQVRILSG